MSHQVDKTTIALQESLAKAEAVLQTTVDGIITIDHHGIIETVNAAAEHIFGYDAGEIIGQNISLLMPAPYKQDHDDYIRSYQETGQRKIIGIGREVIGLRKDGSTFPMELAVSEVELSDRIIFTGIVRDISERRALENEILRISEQERARIGRDLHDGLGQTLTGIGLIAKNVAQRLEKEASPLAKEVAEITGLIKEADQEARTLARGLVPIEFQPEGLSSAIRRLAATTEAVSGVRCQVESSDNALNLPNASTATHLYRIVQEAINNATRHAQATKIKVMLIEARDKTRVRIQDNGKGISKSLDDHPGMGLRIMEHRAHMIGGSLDVRSSPDAGTIVTCTVYRNGIPLNS